ncbi:MAG: hypothetical protein OK439_03810 [Thaumarchaeota archaeon]|nr:hypothetical protein [Nitrososphaerota archaeon]
METEISSASPFLTEKTVSNIKLLCDVARSNGSSLSIRDLILLTSMDSTEDQLIESWKNNEELSSEYEIQSGFIMEKGGHDVSSGADNDYAESLEREKQEISERYLRATSNASYARRFGSFIGGRVFKVLAISGSTSYFSVSKEDDLDFFCIAESGKMWKGLVKSLLLARVFRIAEKNSPWLCLSYVSDEKFARSELAENQDGLFARDAISARTVFGEQYYISLLRENSWMAHYFPKLYNLRVGETKSAELDPKGESSIQRIVNQFLYYTAGSYIKIKSHLLNRKFMKNGKISSLFVLRIGPDHCIYESMDYVKLRKLYAGLKKTEPVQSTVSQ